MSEILPKISIITPVYNRKDYIEQTILSVIGQNYPNLEYIIIDGGSDDGTVDILKKYDKKISYWISESDNGMYDALNKGFQKSTGEIMAWLNSDDLYHQGALLCVGSIFRDVKDIDWIIGNSCLLNSQGLCVKMNDSQKWSLNRIITGDYRWIQQENVFWRRNLWNKAGAGMNSSFKLAADFELWIRFFNYSSLYSVKTSFAGFRLHGQQLSISHLKQYEEEVFKIINSIDSDNLRRCIGKLLFSIVKRVDDNKNGFILFFKINIHMILKRINNYPSLIFYDFEENIWKK